jgi:hypothetical protein
MDDTSNDSITLLFSPLYELVVYKAAKCANAQNGFMDLVLYLWILENSAESMFESHNIPEVLRLSVNEMKTLDKTLGYIKKLMFNEDNLNHETDDLSNSYFTSKIFTNELEWVSKNVVMLPPNYQLPDFCFDRYDIIQNIKQIHDLSTSLMLSVKVCDYVINDTNEMIKVRLCFKRGHFSYEDLYHYLVDSNAAEMWNLYFYDYISKRKFFRILTFITEFVKNSVIFLRTINENITKNSFFNFCAKEYKRNINAIPLTSFFLLFAITKNNNDNDEYLINLLQLTSKIETYGVHSILHLFKDVLEYSLDDISEETLNTVFNDESYLSVCKLNTKCSIINMILYGWFNVATMMYSKNNDKREIFYRRDLHEIKTKIVKQINDCFIRKTLNKLKVVCRYNL